MSDFPYVWFWYQKPGWDHETPPRLFDRERKGERCRVVCRGTMNSALLEFEDGWRTITSRNGIRRVKKVANISTARAKRRQLA